MIVLRYLGLFVLMISLSSMADDAVPILGDNPTDEEIELVREGAEQACRDVDGYEAREECAMDYYAAHNLDEEPTCD